MAAISNWWYLKNVYSLIIFNKQITFLGANSLFGRVASALLRQSPLVGKLKLYDEGGNLHQGASNVEASCLVQWHRGKHQLTDALEGSDIIVIGDDCKITPENEKDSLLSTASRVVDYAFAIAHTVPKAMLVVAASPLNLMVPLAGYVLKELGCFDGRKLLGVTSIDTLRANALYSSYLSQSNAILPVVGGSSPQTRVPIFSHAKPCLEVPQEDQHKLIEEIKSFDLQVQGYDPRPSTIERAYATVRLVHSIISGLNQEPFAAEMALAKTTLIPEVSYFSLPVDLGTSGIERTFGLPRLSSLESEMIEYAVINLNNDLMKAHDLYSTFKPCLDMVKSITDTPKSDHCQNIPKEAVVESSSKIVLEKKGSSKKTNTFRRKKNETRVRYWKKIGRGKLPIFHCPAGPEVVEDEPKSERFGKIKRVHKNLEINEIFQERKPNELPALVSEKNEKLTQDILQACANCEKSTNDVKTVKDALKNSKIEISKDLKKKIIDQSKKHSHNTEPESVVEENEEDVLQICEDCVQTKNDMKTVTCALKNSKIEILKDLKNRNIERSKLSYNTEPESVTQNQNYHLNLRNKTTITNLKNSPENNSKSGSSPLKNDIEGKVEKKLGFKDNKMKRVNQKKHFVEDLIAKRRSSVVQNSIKYYINEKSKTLSDTGKRLNDCTVKGNVKPIPNIEDNKKKSTHWLNSIKHRSTKSSINPKKQEQKEQNFIGKKGASEQQQCTKINRKYKTIINSLKHVENQTTVRKHVTEGQNKTKKQSYNQFIESDMELESNVLKECMSNANLKTEEKYITENVRRKENELIKEQELVKSDLEDECNMKQQKSKTNLEEENIFITISNMRQDNETPEDQIAFNKLGFEQNTENKEKIIKDDLNDKINTKVTHKCKENKVVKVQALSYKKDDLVHVKKQKNLIEDKEHIKSIENKDTEIINQQISLEDKTFNEILKGENGNSSVLEAVKPKEMNATGGEVPIANKDSIEQGSKIRNIIIKQNINDQNKENQNAEDRTGDQTSDLRFSLENETFKDILEVGNGNSSVLEAVKPEKSNSNEDEVPIVNKDSVEQGNKIRNIIIQQNLKDPYKENQNAKDQTGDQISDLQFSLEDKTFKDILEVGNGNSSVLEAVKPGETKANEGEVPIANKDSLEQVNQIRNIIFRQTLKDPNKQIQSAKDQTCNQVVKGKIFVANDYLLEKEWKTRNAPKETVLEEDKKINDLEEKEEKEIFKDKVFIDDNKVTYEEKKIFEIDAKEKLKEIELSIKREMEKLKENTEESVSDQNCIIDSLEQGNKIREITKQKLREPNKELMKSLLQEDNSKSKVQAKDTKGENLCNVQLSENIQVINYQPNATNDKINVTNIDDMLQDFIKENVPQGITPAVSVENDTNSCQEDNVYKHDGPTAQEKVAHIMDNSEHDLIVDSKSTDLKNFNLAANGIPVNDEMSVNTQLLKHEVCEQASSHQKKQIIVPPFPITEKNAKIVEDNSFHKNLWLKTKAKPQEIRSCPSKINLDNVLENKKVSVNAYNIDESFTQRGIKKTKTTVYKPSDIKPLSYTIETKPNRKDDSLKRYTILKKGQICTMIKDDINANELKAKLYKKSILKNPNIPNHKQEMQDVVEAKDLLAKFESSKNTNANHGDVTLNASLCSNSSGVDNIVPLQALTSGNEMLEKNNLQNTSKDVNRTHNIKQSNQNKNKALSLYENGFLNLVLNRISKRSRANDATETISIRGSHNASVNCDYKKPCTPDERKALSDQLIKKAKNQLNFSKIKNNKKSFGGLNGSFPIVSNDNRIEDNRFGDKSKTDKITSAKQSPQKSMAESKNKMQMLKDRYQHLKNTQIYAKPFETGKPIAVLDKKETKIQCSSTKEIKKKNVAGKRFSVGNPFENNKPVPKTKPEQINELDSIINNEHGLQQGNKKDSLLSSFERPVKEMAQHLLEKIHMHTSGSSLISGKDEAIIEANIGHQKSLDLNESRFDNEKINFKESVRNESSASHYHSPAVKSPEPTNIAMPVEKQKTSLGTPKAIQGSTNDKQKEKLISAPENFNISSGLPKIVNDESIMNVKINDEAPPRPKPFTPKKRVFQSRAQMRDSYSSKPDKTNLISLLDPSGKNENSGQSEINPIDKMSKAKSELSKSKPMNEKSNIDPAALNIFATRPSSKELTKTRALQKSTERNTANSKDQREKPSFPALNLGLGGVVENKLVPKHTSASSILLDPNYEKKHMDKKVIPPSLMHAVKAFTTYKTDLPKSKNNFYVRWTPQSLKTNKENANVNIEKDKNKQHEGRAAKNPFVSGRINMTSDLFKDYMKNNRNNDFRNTTSIDDKPLLQLQSGTLSPSSSQAEDTKASTKLSKLGTKPDQKKKGKNDKTIMYPKLNVDSFKPFRPSAAQKFPFSQKEAGPSQGSAVNKLNKLSASPNDIPSKRHPQNVKHSAYRAYQSSKSQSKTTPSSPKVRSNQLRDKEKEDENKTMHLLKAYQDQEKTNKKFLDLQRNFKRNKQVTSTVKTPTRDFRTLHEEKPLEGSPKRLHLLKAFSNESFNDSAHNRDTNRRVQRPFSTPSAYHPSFPLSKPRKPDKDKKTDEPPKTLKKRWTQLLDIFQSVITTEKKNWVQDEPRTLVLAGGSAQAEVSSGPRTKVTRRMQKPSPTANTVQSYYRRHAAGSRGSSSQTRY